MSERLGDAMARLIRERLFALGMTQAEFARKAGVSQKHVSQVLNEKASTPLATLDYWAHVLDMRWSIKLVRDR